MGGLGGGSERYQCAECPNRTLPMRSTDRADQAAASRVLSRHIAPMLAQLSRNPTTDGKLGFPQHHHHRVTTTTTTSTNTRTLNPSPSLGLPRVLLACGDILDSAVACIPSHCVSSLTARLPPRVSQPHSWFPAERPHLYSPSIITSHLDPTSHIPHRIPHSTTTHSLQLTAHSCIIPHGTPLLPTDARHGPRVSPNRTSAAAAYIQRQTIADHCNQHKHTQHTQHIRPMPAARPCLPAANRPPWMR